MLKNEGNKRKLILSDENINELLEQLKIQNEDFEIPDLWKVLNERKKKGLWNGEIEVIETKSHSLIKGKHYYVVENPRTRSIKCISCAVIHGTILEAKFLTRYKIEDGILYFDNKPMNEKADNITH